MRKNPAPSGIELGSLGQAAATLPLAPTPLAPPPLAPPPLAPPPLGPPPLPNTIVDA